MKRTLAFIFVLYTLCTGFVLPGEIVRSVKAKPSPSSSLDNAHDPHPCDNARESDSDSLVLNTKDPVNRITLTRETLQTRPPFLVVSVNCIRNESLASIVVDVELKWQLAGGARTNATIGIIAPFPPDRAENQLMRARDAFQKFHHAQATEEIREASLVFKLRFLHKESQDEPVEVHIAEINWYTEEDF